MNEYALFYIHPALPDERFILYLDYYTYTISNYFEQTQNYIIYQFISSGERDTGKAGGRGKSKH